MRFKHALLATTAAALLTAGGYAQTPSVAQSTAPSATPSPSGSMSPSTLGAATLHEITDDKVMVMGLNVNLDTLADMDIYGADGKKIGEIDRVLADSSNTPKAVTVEAGGFLGMGTTEVIFPLDKLTKGSDAKRLQTTMTKQEVERLDKWQASNKRDATGGNTASGAGGQPATVPPAR